MADPGGAPARTAYVVLAGGSGTRVGAGINKVYLPLAAMLFFLATAIFVVGWFAFGKIFDNTALLFLFAAFQSAAIGLLADVVNVRRSRAPS